MITYTYEKVIYNRVPGWFATRRLDGMYAGKQFGKTKRAARLAFEE